MVTFQELILNFRGVTATAKQTSILKASGKSTLVLEGIKSDESGSTNPNCLIMNLFIKLFFFADVYFDLSLCLGTQRYYQIILLKWAPKVSRSATPQASNPFCDSFNAVVLLSSRNNLQFQAYSKQYAEEYCSYYSRSEFVN